MKKRRLPVSMRRAWVDVTSATEASRRPCDLTCCVPISPAEAPAQGLMGKRAGASK